MKNFNHFISENKLNCNPNILKDDIIDYNNLDDCLESPLFDIERKYGSRNPSEGYTLLFYAAHWNNINLLKKLIKYGANVNTVFAGKNILIDLVTKISFTDDDIKIMDILIENGINLNFKWDNKDIFDILKLGNPKMKSYAFEIPNKFPKQYEKYLREKEMQKFNI